MKCGKCGNELPESARFCVKCGASVSNVFVQAQTNYIDDNKDNIDNTVSLNKNANEIYDMSDVWPEWKIEKQLGRGSYGVVYKAVRNDHNVESYAAIKVISIPSDSSEVDSLRSEGLDLNATKTYLEGIVNDFVSEIQLMESLKGVQNIVSVEDYKVVEKKGEIGWNIYIRMELLTPFNTYICDKSLTEEEIIKFGCDICSALEICESRNIIHRDIKPENIFINDFGHFKLGDFGIARKMENLTGGLSQKGTFNYMAPEVANSGNYDTRADIYSLGIVLYRLLNGNRLPFLNNERQLLNPNERKNAVERRIRGEALPKPCNASPEMANLILRACAFDPNMRFSSATEMRHALMDIRCGVARNVNGQMASTGAFVLATDAMSNNNTFSADQTVAINNKSAMYQSVADEFNATVNAGTSMDNATGTQPYISSFDDSAKRTKTKMSKGKKAKIITILALICIVALAITAVIIYFTSAAHDVYDYINDKDFDNALDDYHYEVKGGFIDELILDSLLDDSIEKTVEKFNSKEWDYETAKECLETLDEMGFKGSLNKLNEITESYANGIVDQYKKGEISYDDAVAKLTELGSQGYEKSQELIDSITVSKNSSAAFEKGTEYYEKGDYENAIAEYSKVAEGDENYKQAQVNLSKVYEDYIESVLDTAESYNTAKNYKKAIQYINSAYDILPDDVNTSKLDAAKEENLAEYKTDVAEKVNDMASESEYAEALELIDEAIAFYDNSYFRNLRTSTEEQYVSDVTKTVNSYLKENNYNSAIKEVNNALGVLPENDDLTELKKKVEKEEPTELTELVAIDSGAYEHRDEPLTDSFGNVYDGYYKFGYCSRSSYVIYYLNDEYTEFHASVVAEKNTDSDAKYTVAVYADGKLLYSLTDFNKVTGKQDISVDVTNVSKLEIRVTKSDPFHTDLPLVNAFVK